MTEKITPIMDYEGSRWRTEFWRGREYEDRVDRIALEALLPPRGTRLLEVGAGFGRLADLYRGYEQVVLLDYARSMLQEARERLGDDPRFVLVAADLYDLPFADSAFDTALTVRVLHHVADLPRAFAQMARVVRPQGVYLTDFANKRHLKAIVKYYVRRDGTASPFTLDPYEFVKLNFDYHPRYIRQNLERAQFHVAAQRGVSIFRVGLLKRTLPTSLLAALDGLLQAPISNLQITPSLFVRAESAKPGEPRPNSQLWRCLKCSGTQMRTEPDRLVCENCGTRYARIDGIWDFKEPLTE